MDEPKLAKRFPNCSVIPLTREEWKAGLEQSIADGISEPNETYESYIAKLRESFDFVCYPSPAENPQKIS